jgi:hypothetical protein
VMFSLITVTQAPPAVIIAYFTVQIAHILAIVRVIS